MATITQENVKFNGTLDDAIVLRDVDNIRTLVLTDKLSAADQAKLEAFIDQYGSNPLSAPTAGRTEVTFAAGTVGGTATGLNGSAATAGKAVVVTQGTVSSGTSSFLNADVGSSGRQTLGFNILDDEYNTSAVVGQAAQAGFQRVVFDRTTFLLSDPTGFANTTAVYQAQVSFDGAAPISLSIQGQDAQTYGDLEAYLTTAVAGQGTVNAFVTDNVYYLEFRSATTGPLSSVEIVDNNLFNSLTDYGSIQPGVDGTASTLSNVTLIVSVDGGAPQTLSISNADLGDVTSIANAISNEITGATASTNEAGNAVIVVSSSDGDDSSIRITGGTIFAAVPGMFTGFPVDGSAKFARTYSAVVIVDGVSIPVSFPGAGIRTYSNVVTALNADLGSAATAAIVDGYLTITSATTGSQSSVVIQDTGSLFSSLQSYSSFQFTCGTDARTYTATVNVDGTNVPVSFPGSAAQTFTTLIAAINADLGAAATAALVGNKVVITSATTGTASVVSIVRDDLFRFISGFAGTKQINGITDLVTALSQQRVGAVSLLDQFEVVRVGDKPAVPPVPATLPKTQAFTYFGGTPAAWRYLEDDTEV